MAQRHIVKSVKERGAHLIRPAQREDFRIAGRGAGDILMCNQHMPHVRFPRHGGQRRPYRVLKGANVLEIWPYGGGTQKRHQPHAHLPVRIAQGMAMQRPVKGRREKHSAPAQQLMAISHLFGRVVIPADGKDGLSQAHGAPPGNRSRRGWPPPGAGACRRDRPRAALRRILQPVSPPGQHGPLVLQQTETIEPAPDMQIGQMQKTHEAPPFHPGPKAGRAMVPLFFRKDNTRVSSLFSANVVE